MGTNILKLTLMLVVIVALIHANTAAPTEAASWMLPQKQDFDTYLRANPAQNLQGNVRFYGNKNRKVKKDYYTDCNYSPLACFIKSRKSFW